MITFEEFKQDFLGVQDDIARDLARLGGEQDICHLVHHDLSLGETTADDAEEKAEKVRDMLREQGEDDEIIDQVNADILDFTVEHHQLHQWFLGVMAEATVAGVSPDKVLMLMFDLGRRYGMREAASMFADAPLTDED